MKASSQAAGACCAGTQMKHQVRSCTFSCAETLRQCDSARCRDLIVCMVGIATSLVILEGVLP